ncbi:MAG: efflux RND transporter periplasmic adaptor subunit [Kiritimatiellia bacterium]|jgi:RND family efflux transporter MFP subunit|nr:efflux RND transporter periplasmic adaptor subunit [Kiritimatiellia bacterium]MDP6630646.1 efflux RND transporter periplasmic adaptor subunit [Kiritimatiellia bacterium]MDP6809491.1 efflux RND transporter periplasmic adaptor subunit [Kiritimatiellia bacterium]MDP7023832.1 efflux RND transporter periplasmic adaptor subunit [Kiritimatiellia bacterium]
MENQTKPSVPEYLAAPQAAQAGGQTAPQAGGSEDLRGRHARGRWRTLLLSGTLLLGMLAALWLVFRDQLTVAIPVDVGTVILLEREGSGTATAVSGERELLFQASGWLEPDPWPFNSAVLTDGFVQDVFVREGEAVTNGQVLAQLDPADATLAKRHAEAGVQRASAKLEEARDSWQRIGALAERDTTASERTAAEQALAARVAELSAASVELETAQLALDRTVIRADRDGIVLRRFVEPGQKRRAAMDDPNSAVIVSLFDPQHLQVRVDVPLAEAGRLFIDQPTRVSTAMLPAGLFTGRVTRIVGQADIQRNTLQVKVAVIDPDPRLRPDVLCRVEFWSDASDSGAGDESADRHALWIPEAALQDEDAAEQSVWVVDPMSQRAHERAIRVSRTESHGYRLLLDGLRANETVVLGETVALEEGCRVRRKTDNER